MHIVADKNIPLVTEAFSGFGELRLIDGRVLDHVVLRDADALLVRSVSRVDEDLLHDTPVAFVGSATAGVDHIDVDYLARKNIQFACAPGSNAQAVAEYVVSALILLAQQRVEPLHTKKLGIIGYGRIGKRVASLSRLLGMECLINDPFLQELPEYRDIKFCTLEEAMQVADFVSLHTPLSKSGRFPTYHLINRENLATLKRDAVLINTARGAVVSGQDLLKTLQSDRIGAVLDVWENEPNISAELLKSAWLASPHVAGYSLEGKLNATAQLHQALCNSFALTSNWNARLELVELATHFSRSDFDTVLPGLLEHICPIREDDRRLRQLVELPELERAVVFDQLRRNYRLRREFAAYRCRGIHDQVLKQRLIEFGFSALKTD